MPEEFERKDEDFHARVIQKTSKFYHSWLIKWVSERSQGLPEYLEENAHREFRAGSSQNVRFIVREWGQL